MKFETREAAVRYLRRHTAWFQKKLTVVPTRYWSMKDEWWVPCWTVVLL